MKNIATLEPKARTRRKNGRIDVTERHDGGGNSSDERLLADFIMGDEAAFAALVHRYSRDLHQFVVRFVGSQATAEDVVQETFVQVHQAASGFDQSRRFRPWLFTIAANKARDYIRSRTRKREVSLTAGSNSGDPECQATYLDFYADDAELPGETLEADEQRRLVSEVVSKMPDNLKEVLVLGYYQRFPYKEIAEVLSIPLGTVKSRLHAAVAHFAEAYKREVERRVQETK